MTTQSDRRCRGSLSDDSAVDAKASIAVHRDDNDNLVFTVALNGRIEIPDFVAAEMIKGHHYTMAQLLIDRFIVMWLPDLHAKTERQTRSALTGVGTFDPEMTHTLR
jgi:hypothetical protein